MKCKLCGILLILTLGACQIANGLSSSPTEAIGLTEPAESTQSSESIQATQSDQSNQPAQSSPVPTEEAQSEPVIVQYDVAITQPYDASGMDMLGQLNAWRVRLGLWPLRPNVELDALALEHAVYLSGLTSLPDDLHVGPAGDYPPDRALAAGWPYYNNSAQIAVTEIAYAGFGVEAAITWWEGSSIHTRSVTNPAFREVGIAAVPYSQGLLFIVLFGGRPDTLPALYEPLTNVFYLSSEQYTWSAGDRIQDATEYQFLPFADYPIDDGTWLPWQSTVSAPEGFGDRYAIAYSDGLHVAISEIDLSTDIAWLPDNLAVPSVAVIGSSVAVAEVPAVVETPVPTPTATPPVIVSGDGVTDLTVVYGQISLAVVNVPPGESLDISGIELVAGDITLPISAWDTEFLGVPLTAFTVGSCVQTWDVTQADPGIPATCNLRASVIYPPVPEIFWFQTSFEVRQDGVTIAICPQAALSGATTCEVDLP